MSKAHFGLIGLGVMGENLVLNAERNGFSSVVFNRTYAKTQEFLAGRGAGKQIIGAETLPEFVAALERPRRILVMVKAGQPVDDMIATLSPLLEEGDLLIDGGNSLYTDTERRVKELESKSFGFIGMGVSGGAKGALEGPSMMPGGTKAAYDAIEGLVRKMAAQVEDGPCVTYIGPGGAGHFVKTVHNGIEYGIEQILAEAYDLMKGLEPDRGAGFLSCGDHRGLPGHQGSRTGWRSGRADRRCGGAEGNWPLDCGECPGNGGTCTHHLRRAQCPGAQLPAA